MSRGAEKIHERWPEVPFNLAKLIISPKSAGYSENYEVLESLGDAALKLLVATELYTIYIIYTFLKYFFLFEDSFLFFYLSLNSTKFFFLDCGNYFIDVYFYA